MLKLSLLLGLWCLESSSMAVNSGVVCLAETMLRRYHYNGSGGPAPKSSGTRTLGVLNGPWCSGCPVLGVWGLLVS